MLYNGTAGIVPVLLEAWRHFGDDAYADTALRAARALAARVDDLEDDSSTSAARDSPWSCGRSTPNWATRRRARPPTVPSAWSAPASTARAGATSSS